MAALVFLSDFYSHWTASDRPGSSFVPSRFQALDHAVWVRRPEHWNGWWLLKAISDVGSAGRMFSRRELYSADGVLVASSSQEGFYARNSTEPR
jgi:acyl-CoA thioesterase